MRNNKSSYLRAIVVGISSVMFASICEQTAYAQTQSGNHIVIIQQQIVTNAKIRATTNMIARCEQDIEKFKSRLTDVMNKAAYKRYAAIGSQIRTKIADLEQKRDNARNLLVCIEAEPKTRLGQRIDLDAKIECAQRKFDGLQAELRGYALAEGGPVFAPQSLIEQKLNQKNLLRVLRTARNPHDSMLTLEDDETNRFTNSTVVGPSEPSKTTNGPILQDEETNRLTNTTVVGPLEPSKTTNGPIQVRGYFRRDGTYVRPHTRSRSKK